MIFTDRTITVRKGESRIDEPIVVYRGDYELEVRFTILNSKFRFMSGTNLIESEKASYGQLAILTPYGGNIFSDIVRCNDGSVTFVLTAEMLNQIEEVGLYSFQIRLMDYTKESRVSIPPIEFGIEVREPIASEDHDNSVNNAIVGYSIAKVVDPKEENVGDTFDESGNYNKTNWETGDRISEGKLNKIEDAIDKVNRNAIDEHAVLNKQMNSNYNVLSTIIDQKRDKSDKITSADLDISRDANKIQLNNLSGEVIRAISGNASVNVDVANSSLTEEKYADNSVADNKVRSFVIGKNLFNKDTVIFGKYVEYHIGTLYPNNDYWVSDYISVLPNTDYTRSYIDQIAFYDSNYQYILGYTYSDPNTITSPSNASYVRVCGPKSKIDFFQFELGDSVTTYEDYRLSVDNLHLDFTNTSVEPHSIKSYDQLDITNGYISGASGSILIDTKAKTMNIVSNNVYVSNYISCYYIIPGVTDLSHVDFGSMVFIYFDINTHEFVFFGNGDYERKKSLLFITCLYGGVMSNNQDAFLINGISPLRNNVMGTMIYGTDGYITGGYNFINIDTAAKTLSITYQHGYVSNYRVCYNIKTTEADLSHVDFGSMVFIYFDLSARNLIFYNHLPRPGIDDNQVFITTLYKGVVSNNQHAFVIDGKSSNISPNLKLSLKNIEGVKPAKNLFNKDTVTLGKYVEYHIGTLNINNSYFTSDYIEVEPDTTYCRTVIDQMAFYDANFEFISGKTYTDPIYFTTPSNAKYIRVCAPQSYLSYYQVELGESPTPYEPFRYEIDKLITSNSNSAGGYSEPLCTLRHAWEAWRNNEKFAIGFLGDSTTDGVGTTGWSSATGHETQDSNNGGWGTVDYICTKSYSYVLEQLIKEEMKTENPRIYNIGYSGTTCKWVMERLEAIFSGVYSDVKMVGLVYGINDRVLATNHKGYSQNFTNNLETVVEFLLKRNIQPFMVTSQAVLEPGTNDPVKYPIRTSESINSVANKCKYEVAKKYGLEVLDMNSFGELVLSYSKYNCTELCKDKLHFGDIGHKLEAGYLFSEICPRTVEVNDTQNEIILSYTSQNVRCDFSSNNLSFTTPFVDGFKIQANYTKSNQNDTLVMDFWVMNSSKGRYELTVHVPKVNGVSYVRLDGVDSVIRSNGQSLGELEIGLHHIQMFTGASTDVSCYGFKMKYKG